jgi:hypothetical protein
VHFFHIDKWDDGETRLWQLWLSKDSSGLLAAPNRGRSTKDFEQTQSIEIISEAPRNWHLCMPQFSVAGVDVELFCLYYLSKMDPSKNF